MIIFSTRRIHDKATVEAFLRAQFFLADLMTDGTGNAIFGGGIFLGVLIKRKMGENCSESVFHFGLVASDGHVAGRTFVFNFCF